MIACLLPDMSPLPFFLGSYEVPQASGAHKCGPGTEQPRYCSLVCPGASDKSSASEPSWTSHNLGRTTNVQWHMWQPGTATSSLVQVQVRASRLLLIIFFTQILMVLFPSVELGTACLLIFLCSRTTAEKKGLIVCVNHGKGKGNRIDRTPCMCLKHGRPSVVL
jgi:hypothetical protein